MSKEMLKQADDWLHSMHCLLSVKTDKDDRAYTQERIDLFNWLVKQANRVEELENDYQVRRSELIEEHIERLEKVNKRYRESLKEILEMQEETCVDEVNEMKQIARKALEDGE